MSLYLVEFYTSNPVTGEGGYDINFAWVYADTKAAAEIKLVANQGERLDEIIQISEHSEITQLAGDFKMGGPDANLFIIGSLQSDGKGFSCCPPAESGWCKLTLD